MSNQASKITSNSRLGFTWRTDAHFHTQTRMLEYSQAVGSYQKLRVCLSRGLKLVSVRLLRLTFVLYPVFNSYFPRNVNCTFACLWSLDGVLINFYCSVWRKLQFWCFQIQDLLGNTMIYLINVWYYNGR